MVTNINQLLINLGIRTNVMQLRKIAHGPVWVTFRNICDTNIDMSASYTIKSGTPVSIAVVRHPRGEIFDT